MALRCAYCNNSDVEFVCHHCGKPLCKKNLQCRVEISDSAFGASSGSSVVAVHCRECWQRFHPGTPART